MTRRKFIAAASAACGVAILKPSFAQTAMSTTAPSRTLLQQFPHGAVKLTSSPLKQQFDGALELYMKLDNDSILKVYRELSGLPAPGNGLAGWYATGGFAPGHAFGQWLSALSRFAQATDDTAVREKVMKLVHGFAESIDGPKSFYEGNRFKGYTYDKHVIGLTEACTIAGVTDAKDVLRRATDLALKVLPEKALTREEQAQRPHKDVSYTWDEFYTLPENLFLAHEAFGDNRYLEMARRYMHDKPYFEPLAAGKNALVGQHAYSHVNALSSAARAYLTLGDDMHLRAIKNGWDFIHQQSFATGGWGPNETFVEPGKGKLAESLTGTHNHFETPCGSYAHFKLARYLMRITGESRFGDSLERMLYNGIGAAKPVQPDGSTFYYSDYSANAHKGFHGDKWPCCSGTYPQVIADFLVSMYFQGDYQNIFINLYAPSKLTTWGGTLTQTTNYPDDDRVSFSLKLPGEIYREINFRIPQWTTGWSITVNGERQNPPIERGFAKMLRTWKDGDKIELTLPLAQRTQPIDEQHPNLVAELRGPLVMVTADKGKIPFREIKDEAYTMYASQS